MEEFDIHKMTDEELKDFSKKNIPKFNNIIIKLKEKMKITSNIDEIKKIKEEIEKYEDYLKAATIMLLI